MKKSGTQVGTDLDNNNSCQDNDKKSRGWFFTINNPKIADDNEIEKHKSQVRYMRWVLEKGNECGTLHYHVIVYYKNPRVWPRRFFKRASDIKPIWDMNGVLKYTEKDDTHVDGPWEYGEKPEQGRRTDLEEIATKAVSEGLKKIADDHPAEFVRYHRGLKALIDSKLSHRTEKPKVLWLWGKSGTGKTKYAFDNYSEIYIKDGTPWWDGYEQQEVIVIDDFDGKWPFRDLLRLLDRYPYQGQVKGGYVKINSDIIITCEFPPERCWAAGNTLEQVLRRIDEVIEMK